MKARSSVRLGQYAAALVVIASCVHCKSASHQFAGAGGGGSGPDTSPHDGGSEPTGGQVADDGFGGVDQTPHGEAGNGAGVGGDGTEPAIMPEGPHHGFVLDTIEMPNSAADAARIGFDLNGDDVVDNAFGKAMFNLSIQGLKVNEDLDTKVQNGQLVMLADLQAASLTNARTAGFLTYFGSNPQPAPCAAVNDCGRHLDGTGAFDIAEDSRKGSACVGSMTDSVFSGKGGDLPLRIAIGEQLTDLVLHDARVQLAEVSAQGFINGRLGGALSPGDVNGSIYPAIHTALATGVALNCTGAAPPSCGCTESSLGKTAITLFDDNDDCSVSLAEVKTNPALTSLFTLDLDSDGDGTADALSCAVSITGKKATFDLP